MEAIKANSVLWHGQMQRSVQPATSIQNDPDILKEKTVMANTTQATDFPTAQPRRETAMEKTTRAVKDIKDAEAEKRQDKRARLRKARHESETNAPSRQQS